MLRVAVNKLCLDEIHWNQQEFNENRRNTGTRIYLTNRWFSYTVKRPTNLHSSSQHPVQQGMRPLRPLFVCLMKIILSLEVDGRPWALVKLVKLGIKQEQPGGESLTAMFGSTVLLNDSSTTASMS